MSGILSPVSAAFRDPIRGIVPSGEVTPQTFPVPSVPELAVTKDDDTGASKDQIRLAGKFGDIFPVTEAEPPHLLAKQFVRRVVPPVCSFRARSRLG